MKILISGSVRNDNFFGEHSVFKDACRKIGKHLAEKGHHIIVGSDNAETADLYVTEGYCEVQNKNNLIVYVYSAQHKAEKPYKLLRTNNTSINFSDYKSSGPWSVNRVEQIDKSDCVLLIGGGKGTLQSGLVAPTLEKPVVAVSCFNGSAKDVWDRIESRYSDKNKILDYANKLKHEWVEGNEKHVLELLEIVKYANPYKTKSYLPNIIYVAGVVSFISLWLTLFFSPVISNTISLFLLMGISSVLGTGVNNALAYLKADDEIIRWEKIIMETGSALVVGLGLTLGYFLFGGAATGQFSFDFIEKTTDFQRVAVFMSLIGLYSGFSFVESTNKLSKLLKKTVNQIK